MAPRSVFQGSRSGPVLKERPRAHGGETEILQLGSTRPTTFAQLRKKGVLVLETALLEECSERVAAAQARLSGPPVQYGLSPPRRGDNKSVWYQKGTIRICQHAWIVVPIWDAMTTRCR